MLKTMKNTILSEKIKSLDEKDAGYMVLVCKNKKEVDKMNFLQVICNYMRIKKFA